MASSRDIFSSRRAAIYAMAGSAIGLGNIWRFPYMVGEHGGAAFIIVYLVSTILLSLPLFLAESVIGRRTHLGARGAMERLAPGTPWRHLGVLTFISALVILSFYSVVGGWSIDYFIKSLKLDFLPDHSEEVLGFFSGMISRVWLPLVCHTAFIALTAVIVVFGITKGIERFSNISMPILFVLIIVIMLYSLSMPGAGEGIRYLVKPDFSKLDAGAVAGAMGQSFFSLSLGVGTILTYASHIRKSENLLTSGVGTIVFDLFFAILAGFAVMPAVFAAGIEPGAGPGLIFETLPYIFSRMGAQAPILSSIIAILFFLTILVAALTSSISMMETGVTYLMEQKGFRRGPAVLLFSGAIWALGCLCSLSFGPLSEFKILGCNIFDLCDKLSSNFLMTIGGLLFVLFVGWKMRRSDVRDELTSEGLYKTNGKLFGVLYFLIRYVAPVVIAIVFISNLLM